MLFHSPLAHRTIFLLTVVFFLFSPQVPGHAEEMASPCKGLRGKELVLCWRKVDPERPRGDHDAFHRGQSAVHLKWHQEHRGMTDAQVTVDHQKLHQDTARKHQEFHRSTKVGGGGMEKKEVAAPAQQRDAKSSSNKGLSKRRQLRLQN